MTRRTTLRQLAGPAAVFAVALLGFGWLFSLFPALYDTDSYYHLAIARLYAHQGVAHEMPQLRFSLFRDGFGDKEVLFHLLNAPFARGDEAARGGRLALALWNALIAAVLAFLGVRAAGRWGLLLPLLVYAGSLDFLLRAVRLRPELLSLVLLLVAAACAASGRYRLLGLVALVYTLSYTAFQALLGLCFAWFAERLAVARRFEPWLVLYPLLGVGLGLLLHPHFPHNLVVWKVQSFDFFALKGTLDVGAEIGPRQTDEVLRLHFAWWLALLVLGIAARRCDEAAPADDDARQAATFHVATAAFAFLYLLMGRFSIYFIPFATLSFFWELRRRGFAVRKAFAPVLVVVALLGLGRSGTMLYGMATAGRDQALGREDDWAAFGRAVPPEAFVAAEWGSTHLYLFWAPQGLYLNVLDPIFMAVPYPKVYEVSRALFEGREPDVPYALAAGLESDYLALSRFHPHPRLLERLAGDPRLEPRYQGYTLLYRVVDERNTDLVLDWHVVPPSWPGGDLAALPAWPRAEAWKIRVREGFVDVDRVDPEAECLLLARDEEVDAPEERLYELAPWGPTTLRVDGRLAVAVDASPGAVLGQGTLVPIALEAGVHRFEVRTCRGDGGRAGFYLRRGPSEIINSENRRSHD